MTTQKVYRDTTGTVINIGDWDYQYKPVMADDKTQPLYDLPEENPQRKLIGFLKKQVGEVAENPMPEGVYESTAEIIQGSDGGFYDSNNYQGLRRNSYPAVGDQLDALYKAGVFPKDMAAKIEAVKTTYPKPAETK